MATSLPYLILLPGGSIPLEAQRLGLEAHASDLNPLAVLITKGLIEIPPRFAGRAPIHPGLPEQNHYQRAEGLAEDIRFYGQWMRDTAEERIGHLYPKAVGPDGSEYTVIAWKWARTVTNPNPANPIETPLVSSWWLSKKKGKEAWVRATVEGGQVRYEVINSAEGPKGEEEWTIKHGKGAKAVGDGTPFSYDYIRQEGVNGRIGAHLIAVVAEGRRGRLYLSPSEEHEKVAACERPLDVPDEELAHDPRNLWTPAYGLTKFSDLFTSRQLVAMTTFSDLVAEVRERALRDALASGMVEGERLEDGGSDARAYADALGTYLALAVGRLSNRSSTLSTWNSSSGAIAQVFTRQSIRMIWDYAEGNPFSNSSGNFMSQVGYIVTALKFLPMASEGTVDQISASERSYSDLVISTDPPYYDNIGYSDLSDYFYVWLRRSLAGIQSKLVGTMLTPKADELVANPYRHNGKEGAAQFFIQGFNSVFHRIRLGANPNVPMTVYYAYKQKDVNSEGAISTGWHTLLDGLIGAGWEITATWPVQSERKERTNALSANTLASSIVLACRPREDNAPSATSRAFIAQLRSELPQALRTLMQGAVAPVDLAQAAIGPGISVFSRYSRVREANGSDMGVRDALLLINATLDEVLEEQESDFDAETRFAVKWYRSFGWKTEEAGIADQLARSADTSIGTLQRGGIFEAKGGKARLLSPSELDGAWDPRLDNHLSVWEVTVRLAAIMAKDGEDRVVEVLASAQELIDLDAVKELGFLLFHEAEKQSQTQEALLFNSLVTAWSDLVAKAARIAPADIPTQPTFDFTSEED